MLAWQDYTRSRILQSGKLGGWLTSWISWPWVAFLSSFVFSIFVCPWQRLWCCIILLSVHFFMLLGGHLSLMASMKLLRNMSTVTVLVTLSVFVVRVLAGWFLLEWVERTLSIYKKTMRQSYCSTTGHRGVLLWRSNCSEAHQLNQMRIVLLCSSCKLFLTWSNNAVCFDLCN